MASKKKRAGIEWVGGLVSMPAYVTGEGDPYRPEVLFWMSPEGAVLGHTAGKPGELVGLASASLRSTIERPMFGQPHAPQRVRVASPELAEALRAGHAGLEVVCAPTPESDAVLAVMREKLNEDAETGQSYLSPELGPEAIAAFFHAAAELFRSRPWKTVPSDQSLFSVTIEQLGVNDAALSVSRWDRAWGSSCSPASMTSRPTSMRPMRWSVERRRRCRRTSRSTSSAAPS
jgi:hypothetical protein